MAKSKSQGKKVLEKLFKLILRKLIMVEDVYTKRAKEYLHDAHYEEMKGNRRSPQKLVSLYEKAGDALSKTKDLWKAENAYRDALKYARRYSKEEDIKYFEKKILDLGLQQRKLRHGFEKMRSGLESKFGFLSITALAFAFFFVSTNLTGNVIAGFSLGDSRWIGICFFLCGLTLAFFYLKSKK
jgi:hypothetical protein